jgi:ribosomal protein L12E/L44/L45/RPP1/RPP2
VKLAPPLFGFVAVGRFHEQINPAKVVINDTKIIKQTKEITEIERANRTIGGVQQKVVINEGPGVAVVQKATGQKIPEVPIQEAVRQSPAPRSGARATTKPEAPSSEAAASKDQKAQQDEPSEKDKQPGAEPAQPSKGKKPKSDSNWWGGGKGHGKGKP